MSARRASARDEERAQAPVEPPNWVGQSVPRVEDPALVRGWGNYVADIAARDRCLYAVFVRSAVASGRILSVTAPPHVRLVTAVDLEGIKAIAPMLNRPDYVRVEMPVLARDVVRFNGEPIAMVLADTPAEAEDAADLVVVEIEALPPVLRAEEAVLDESPLVHPGPFPGEPNTALDAHLTTAGYDDALKRAARTVNVRVSSGRQSAMPMEARAAHVAYDRSSGRTTLSTTTQCPHVIRTGICDMLEISEDLLRVIAPDVGGGFGAKQALAREDVALVHAARRFKRNLAWIETREENFMASWHSREQSYEILGAFAADGRLLALGADIVADVGAYSCYPYTYGVEPLMAFAELPGAYRVEEYSARARAILTNKCPIAPYRGVSRPVQVLALERLMDVAATQLGIDRIEMRRINLVQDYPHVSPTGLVLDASSHLESLAKAVETIDLAGFPARQSRALAEGRYIGVGFSCFSERTGYGTPAFASRNMAITPGYEQVELAFDPSGNLVLRIGASPHGQGLRTTLAQVVADELGVEPSVVRVVHSDTDTTPYGWGSYASRSMVIAGGASKLAGAQLREKVMRVAAEMMECATQDVEVRDGAAWVRGSDVSVALSKVARFAHHSSHLLPDGDAPGLGTIATYDPAGTFSNAVHVAEVEVDPLTGAVSIDRFIVVEDAGLLVNPAIVEGQVHGGVAQGIANALFEELIYDDRGVLVTTSLMDYLPPTAAEIPEIEIHHLETISEATITGAKGVGEGGTIGAPAAVLNAICDALSPFEVELFHIPATPHTIRRVVREARDASPTTTNRPKQGATT